MALQIVDGCTNCHACLPLCPGEAIREARPHFMIDAAACAECLGDFADPQCASICPIEGAIVDAQNRPLNPIGSLTGIAPELWARYRAAAAAYGST